MLNKTTFSDLVNNKLNPRNVSILCVTEQWLDSDNLQATSIDNFKLVSYFSWINKDKGGASIFMKILLQILNQSIYIGGV